MRPDTPEGLAEVVAKMMAKDLTARYQTPAEVYEALAPWTQTPIPPPPEEEMPKSGVHLRGGGLSDARLASATNAAMATMPWLNLPPASVFPGAITSADLPAAAPPTTAAPLARPGRSWGGPRWWLWRRSAVPSVAGRWAAC